MVQTLDDPWAVCEEDYPWHGTSAEQLRFLLNYAVLAPSVYNTQPWLFKISGSEVELYVDRTRALPVSDPRGREILMSCGAALLHLRVAIQHYGFHPLVRTFPDTNAPDLVACVRIGPQNPNGADVHGTFEAIKKRRTNRLPFEQRSISEAVLHEIVCAAQREGAHVHVIEDEARRLRLAELIDLGDRTQTADKLFRRELADWMRPNRSGNRDGIPGYAQGMGDLVSLAGPLLVRTFEWGKGEAAKNRELADGSPALLVLSTFADSPPAWMAAGQALSQLLLTASEHSLYASFLNQPIEVASLRAQVAELAGTTRHPQIILRIGYGQPVGNTPRRPVQEVTVTHAPRVKRFEVRL